MVLNIASRKDDAHHRQEVTLKNRVCERQEAGPVTTWLILQDAQLPFVLQSMKHVLTYISNHAKFYH